jgi:hypothetical protein
MLDTTAISRNVLFPDAGAFESFGLPTVLPY